MHDTWTLIFCIFIFNFTMAVSKKMEQRSLYFTQEPPEYVAFYNTTGAVISCTARGEPQPTLRWETRDGSVISEIPGLRHVRPDGSLVFPPFQPDDYRQDIHASVYRCTASNNAGTIGSRDVHVKGMVKQPYKIQVVDEFTVSGNTAVLRCNIPGFVKDYVHVTSWVRDDSVTIVASADRGGRYSIFAAGELHIRGATGEDGFKSYRCVAKNKLSGEVTPSSSAGKLFVTDARSSLSPRITHTQTKIEAEVGQIVELPCAAQAYPLPSYTWYRVRDGLTPTMKRIDPASHWVSILNSTLLIRKASVQDGGKYVCVVNNSHGQERAESELLIREKLVVRVLPPSQIVDVGKTAIFNCNVSGHPVHVISWRKDMQPVMSSRRIVVSREELRISQVERDDKGMYQCFVYNDKESTQDTAQLILGDVSPVLKYTFEPSKMEPGAPLSLKCIATGNPLPQVTWTLDNLHIPDHIRFSVGDYVTSRAEVVSFVNISSLRVEDGGIYRCQATNDLGTLSHSAKVNVIGPPFVRMMKDIAAVEGNDLVVRCPVAGYPVEEVYWEKEGRRIPYNHRQKAFKNGTLIIRTIDKRSDGGEYKCVARNSQGQRGERQLTIKVLTPPVIEPFNLPDAIEEGSRSKLLCSVTKGDPPITVEWTKDKRPLPFDLGVTETTLDEFSKALIFSRVDLRHRGNYTCIASNMAALATYTVAMVIHAPPRWTIEPPHSAAVLKSDVVLNCVAEGFPKPKIEWKRAEGALSSDYRSLSTDAHIHSLVNGSLSIRNIQRSDEGYYMCQATNGIGSGISTVITLSVRVPAHFKEQFNAETVRRGESVTVKCQAFGDRPLTVTWKKDGQPLDKKAEKQYTIDETMTDEGITSEVRIQSADRRDSSLFTCIAENAYGKDEKNIQIIVQEHPDKPFKVTAHESSSRGISLSWSPPYSGNSPILLYKIQCKLQSATWKDAKETTASGAESKTVVSGLQPATTYNFRLMAENAFGRSDYSTAVSATTDLEVPGGPPLNIRVEAVGSHTLRVTWQPPAANLQNGRLAGYYVGYKVHGSQKPYTYKTLELSDEFRNECLITNLKRLTSYSVIVQAFNRRGAGPPSDEVAIKTKDNDPPMNPILNIVTATHFSIQVQWNVRNTESSPITGFRLHYKRELGGWQEVRSTRDKRMHSFENLQCGTRYHFYMTAFNDIGEGLPSDTVNAKTLGVVPVAPSQQTFLRINFTQVSLLLKEWNDGGCIITFFVIQYRVETEQEWTLVSDHILLQTEPFELEGLVPGTWYRLHVMAHNDAGSTQAEYTFSTNIINDVAGSPMSPVLKNNVPFYTNLAIVAPVVVTVMIVAAVLIVVCALSQRRRTDNGQYEETQSVRKEINTEAVQMSEYEVKQQDGTYVHSKDPLYYPSPYATSRVPVFSLEERSSGESSTDGRSILHDIERPYDVPFASENTKHMKGGKELTQSEVEHMYSFPNRQSSGQHPSHRKDPGTGGRRWSSGLDEEYVTDSNGRPRSTATPSSVRWQSSSKQGALYPHTSCRDGYVEDDGGGSPFHFPGSRDLGESSDAECDRDQLLFEFRMDEDGCLAAKMPYHIALGKEVIFQHRSHIEI